jgi:cell wall-associated NlpC family hydrolase
MRREQSLFLSRKGSKRRMQTLALFSTLSIGSLFTAPELRAEEQNFCTIPTTVHSSIMAPVKQSGESIKTLFTDIRQYLGIRYRFGGQTPAGFDCSGFVRFMFGKVFDMKLPRSSREMSTIGTRVQREELRPGDLVFFQNGHHINHVGIFVGNGAFVHSSLSRGITRDNLNENYFNHRFAGAVRLLDVPQETLQSDIEKLIEEKGNVTTEAS